MISSLEKGNALEAAVRGIEMAILRSSPALSENTFKIESKKHFVVEGVRHEIDVYVEVDIGQGYKAVFIFECKNWEAVVGKNEIIIFSEKIKALNAQKGFFVAKSVSSDAEAQAKKDARVELLVATEHSAAETPLPFDFHTIIREREKTESQIEFRERGVDPLTAQLVQHAVTETKVIYKGATLPMAQLAGDWIDNVVEENLNHFSSNKYAEGVYEQSANREQSFEEGELIADGRDIAKVFIKVRFLVQVVRPPIISHFEVATRGRSVSFAPVGVGANTVAVSFIFHQHS